jgi:hypothetical protein
MEDTGMFSVHCPRHGSDVLLTERRIVGLEPSSDGITVRWVCWCGHQGSHHTGRARRPLALV